MCRARRMAGVGIEAEKQREGRKQASQCCSCFRVVHGILLHRLIEPYLSVTKMYFALHARPFMS